MADVNPSASYSLTMRIELPSAVPAPSPRVAAAIAEAHGDVGAIDLVRVTKAVTLRDITVSAADSDHGQRSWTRCGRFPASRSCTCPIAPF